MIKKIFLLTVFLLTSCQTAEIQQPTQTPWMVTATPIPTSTIKPTSDFTPTADVSILPKYSYSQVVNTYPPEIELCNSEAEVVDVSGTQWLLSIPEGSNGIEIKNSVPQIQCFGAKITLQVEVSIDGQVYPPGTKLTVDKDLNWIAVSSWE